MSRKVSVILPVYNAENTVKQALISIVNQTYNNLEIIIINDGSNDNTEEIVRSVADSRIIYVKNDKNEGLIYTLNRGLSMATGEYIARMDADDISLPDRLEKQVNFLDNNKDYIMVGGQIEFFGNTNSNKAYILPCNDDDIRAGLLYYCPFYHPTVLFRKEVVSLYKLFYNKDYIHAEDYKMWSDISAIGKMYNIPDIVLKYRISDNQISNKYSLPQIKKSIQIKRENIKSFLKNINFDYDLPQIVTLDSIKLFNTIKGQCEYSPNTIKLLNTILFLLYFSCNKKIKLLYLTFYNIRSFTFKQLIILFLSILNRKKWIWYNINYL